MQFESITRNGDFVRAYKRGKAFVHPHVVLYVNKNRVGRPRVGITASKKVGNAVVRNRARRVIRHALMQSMPQGLRGVDLVLVARGQTPLQKSTTLAKTLAKLFGKAGLAPGANPPDNALTQNGAAPVGLGAGAVQTNSVKNQNKSGKNIGGHREPPR